MAVSAKLGEMPLPLGVFSGRLEFLVRKEESAGNWTPRG